jgi:hypothetical protein
LEILGQKLKIWYALMNKQLSQDFLK